MDKKKCFSIVLLPAIVSMQLFGGAIPRAYEEYISEYKQKEFAYDYEKNSLEALKLRDSWIAPLEINYAYSRSNPYIGEQITQSASVRMNQPIFQSGGIYYGIKFANAKHLFDDYSTQSRQRSMIKETMATLFSIRQYDLKEKKQHLLVANAAINVAQKQEEYLSGQLDSGFLDNAIIQKNSVVQTLFDIETAKAKLIAKFRSLSDKDYTTTPLPHLSLITKEEFLQHNIALQLSHVSKQQSRYAKNVRIAAYLPRVSLTAAYNWNKKENQQFSANIPPNSEENNYYSYGFSISMPIDINTRRDVESARVDYLKAKVLQQDKLREEQALFEQVMQNIENYKKKIALSEENIALYTKLLKDTKELFVAGYKTAYDVDTLKNSVEIQKIDKAIYEIDQQLELLNLYEIYNK